MSEHTVRLEPYMETWAWVWVCTCGAQSKRTWDSKYAARHAGQNHRQRNNAEREKERA